MSDWAKVAIGAAVAFAAGLLAERALSPPEPVPEEELEVSWEAGKLLLTPRSPDHAYAVLSLPEEGTSDPGPGVSPEGELGSRPLLAAVSLPQKAGETRFPIELSRLRGRGVVVIEGRGRLCWPGEPCVPCLTAGACTSGGGTMDPPPPTQESTQASLTTTLCSCRPQPTAGCESCCSSCSGCDAVTCGF